MLTSMSKKVLIGVIATVVVIWFIVSSTKKPTDVTSPAPQTATSTNTTLGATTTSKTTTTAKKAQVVLLASKPVSMSYQKALETYKEGFRLQLSGTDFCQLSPNNVTYKNGTSIMVDNRSPRTHSVKIGGTYTIEGYGFRIIKLSSSSLPATLFVDCDTQQNVAKILLQK